MQGPAQKHQAAAKMLKAASLGLPTYLKLTTGPRKPESKSETESRCVL